MGNKNMKKPLLSDRMITYQKDTEYFTQYPAPILELLHSTHFTNINSTITFFGPMMYFLLRALGCEQVLEIGHAECYTAYYMAHAVKDNGIRFGMKNNMYYGIDIVQTEKAKKNLTDAGLPNTIMNMDSMKLTPETFKGIPFDLIFQDGSHKTDHVLHEMNILYPQLKSGGYWIFHDAAGPAEEAWHLIIKNPKYKFEHVRILCVYGLGILHKIEGLDPEKRYWT